MEENLRALWVALKERYDQQKAIILPEAKREWSLLRLMDFKSAAEYNSTVHKIYSKLHFLINLLIMQTRLKIPYLHFSLQIGYCNSNTATTTIPNILT
jgi:hypothetical protein